MASAKGRDATYDIARGIGMTLVIYGHLLEALFPARPDLGKPFIDSAFLQWQVIYSFHMVLFFFISGAVNRSLPNKAWPDVLRGSLRLLALVWVVHLIGIFFVIAFGYAPDARKSFYDGAVAVLDPIIEGSSWSIGVLWFLTSLCFVQILAYFVLRRTTSFAVVIAAIAIGIGAMYAPNYFLFRSWFPGLAFFVMGFLMTKWNVKLPVWLWLPLVPLLVWLAPLNTGCHFTLVRSCYDVGPGLFGVWMFAGIYGFIPLFYLSGILGALAVVSLSRGLARFQASKVFVYMGQNSLNLFIVNGFVAVFLSPIIATIPLPKLTVFHYVALFVAIVGAHLIAIMALKPILDLIDKASIIISNALTELLTGRQQVAASKIP